MSLNLASFIDRTAESCPDKTAIILDEHKLTYAQLCVQTKRVANVLKAKGVGPGDKVAMMIPNTPHFPIVYYAILHLGATVVPVNVLLTAPEIEYYLEDSEATVFVTFAMFYEDSAKAFQEVETCGHLLVVAAPEDVPVGERLEPLAEAASPECEVAVTSSEDTAVILYTSGTTGHPKGAELTQFNVFFNAYYAQQRIITTREDDVALAVLPLFHSFGQTCVMNATLLAGGTITLVPSFSTDKVLEVIQRDRVTLLSLVPTMYFFILHAENADDFDLSSIRMAVSGGAALPVEVMRQFKEKYGVQILEGYGLSETSPVASFNVIERPCKPGSIGLPIWGTEMKVMREDGTLAELDEVGEIVVRGHNVMKGYYNKPVATEEAVVDGWLHTGDLGREDDEGYFFVVDRKKDMILRGGENIYPREIEEVLYGHPAVQEACVVGIPDEIRGEEVKAFLALKEGTEATEEDVAEYCKERLAKYKLPRIIEFLPTLPKGPTGKILKRELRDQS